jgi:hypothetical protein
MPRFTVRLHECSSSDSAVDKTVRVLLRDSNPGGLPVTARDAVPVAIRKMFGRECFWLPDSGLGFFYGQVFRPVSARSGGGNSSVTMRSRIDITEGW